MGSGTVSVPARLAGWAAALPVWPSVGTQECSVALARVGLGSVLFAGSFLSPDLFGTGSLLPGVYLVYSVGALAASGIQPAPPPLFSLLLHAADICWPLALYLLAPAPPGLAFVLLMLFPPLAAAYRWGFWETAATAAAAALLLLSEVAVESLFHGEHPAVPRLTVHLNPAAGAAIGLMCLATLLSYALEHFRRSRLQSLAARTIIPRAWVRADLSGALDQAFAAFLAHFGAERLAVALHENDAQHVYLWEAASGARGRPVAAKLSVLPPPRGAGYFFPVPAPAWRFPTSRGARLSLRPGRAVKNPAWAPPASLCNQHGFRSIFGAKFSTGEDWSGHLFLFNPRPRLRPEAELRVLASLVSQLAPGFYGTYRFRRLRSRVRAAERRHIARELHDGIIQSLSGLEMRLELLRRRAATGGDASLAGEIAEVQKLMRQEISGVRELMQKFKFRDLGPTGLLGSVEELVERFQQETGIGATFSPEITDVELPSSVCRELALIVLEALANVRKHSAARNVSIRLGLNGRCYRLIVQDDGRGFGFAGRLTQTELESAGKLPRVIGERVKIIHGELAIESSLQGGASLEVLFPVANYGA
ncbi:MAG: sensor histidine kinase [Terriglobia bacterium]